MDQLSTGIRILRPIKVLSVLIFVILFTTGCSTLSINKDLQDTKNYKQTQSYQDADKEFTEYEIEQFTNSSSGGDDEKFSTLGTFFGILILLLLFLPFKKKERSSSGVVCDTNTTCAAFEIIALFALVSMLGS
jgi:hypothetical protein